MANFAPLFRIRGQAQEKNSVDAGKRPTKLKEYLKKLFWRGALESSGKIAENRGKIWRRYLLRSGLWALFSFFISRTALTNELCPFGIAFCGVATRYIPALLLGNLAVLFDGGTPEAFLAALLTLTVRFCIGFYLYYDTPDTASVFHSSQKKRPALTSEVLEKPRIFGESIYLRMASGTIGAFVVSIVRIASGQDGARDVIAAVLMLVLVPVLIFLYAGIYDSKTRSGPLWEAGVAAVCFTVVISASEIVIKGISLGIIAAFFLTLYISRDGGLLRGGMLGLIMGFACYPAYAPLFGLCGFASGIFWGSSAYAAVSAGCALSVFYGVYIGGFAALRTLLPSVFIAAVLFLALQGIKVLPRIHLYSRVMPAAAKEQKMEAVCNRGEMIEKDVTAFATALHEISDSFFEMSEHFRRPSLSEIEDCIQAVCNHHCSRCPSHYLCWENERALTEEYYAHLKRMIWSGGRSKDRAVPEYMKKCCRHTEEMQQEIDSLIFSRFEESLKRDKSEVFAFDYECMAKMLEYLMKKSVGDTALNSAVSQKLQRAAGYLNLDFDGIAAFGERRLKIVAGGVDPSHQKLSSEQIRTKFEAVSGCRLGSPRFCLGGDYSTMVLDGAACFDTDYAIACSKKEDEKENGDDIALFRSTGDYFYTVLCDGMGSGKEAHLTAGLACRFLEKMLSGGGSKEIAVEMLNTFLRTRKTECSTTVDLLEIDLIKGTASFFKSGAACSMILRDGNIFKIASASMPIGVMRGINGEQIDFALQAGDVIVMLSDGIAQNFEESIWLATMLSEEWNGEDMEAMAKQILKRAQQEHSKQDDMTVALIHVTKI